MIVCQNCKSQQPDGSIFCSDCGTQMPLQNSVQTQRFSPKTDQLVIPETYVNDMSRQNGAWISLHLLDSGNILAFTEQTEFTLGRLSDNQPIEPDVDLTPFKAFENGVSRLHAVIKHIENSAILIDLGSSNGTYVNGIRIMPNIEQRLRHGDIVALGKLKMQVVLS